MAGKHWKPNERSASGRLQNVMQHARRASEWWRNFEARHQAPLIDEIQPHISAARRLAYLLYGDWFAADAALGRAVRRFATPWRRWWHRGVEVDTLLGDDLVRQYVVEHRSRFTGLRRWLPRRRVEVTQAQTDVVVAQPLLLATLEDLTARQRAVLVCRHYRGMDPAVTAGLLGTSEVDVAADLMAASGIVTTAFNPHSGGSGKTEPVILTGEVVEESGAAGGRR
jgi:DNA-directed RNA polymerase specialized sigma24 family protein